MRFGRVGVGIAIQLGENKSIREHPQGLKDSARVSSKKNRVEKLRKWLVSRKAVAEKTRQQVRQAGVSIGKSEASLHELRLNEYDSPPAVNSKKSWGAVVRFQADFLE